MTMRSIAIHNKCLWGVLILAVGLFGQRVLAQTTTGTIYGSVADQSGAVIPNAAVTITNVQTGDTHRTTSNASGNYTFPAVSPGNYSVSTKFDGFRSETQSNIQVGANQNVHVSFSLVPGAASQSVTVSAATTLVDTRESQIGETVDQKRIANLPLNGRNAYDLVQIVPGVTNYTAEAAIGDKNGASFSANGVRTTFNTYYLDGASDGALFDDGGNIIPNPDALQEFRLLTSNFDAEFGRSPGGVVNLITRSGTNHFHGLAYDYLRNNVLNAKNYFNNEVTPLKQNQFGGNMGGPILKYKAFFFLSYEGLRIRTPAIVSSSLITLTAAEAKGDFSAPNIKPTPVLPAGTNCGSAAQPVICSAALDPVVQNLLKYVPLEDPVTGLVPEQTAPANTNADQGLARVDYQLTAKHALSAMFFTSRGTNVAPDFGGNQVLDFSGSQSYVDQTNSVVSDRWTVSPNALNSLNLFYSLNHTDATPIFDTSWSDWGSQIAQGSFLKDQPFFTITGYWGMGLGQKGGDINIAQQSFGAFDTFNWIRGNHTIKMGGSFVWNDLDQTGVANGSGTLAFTGSTTKNALADFLMGKANTFSQIDPAYPRVHQADPALFFQDDWKMTHRLTLDLGLRWEMYPPFRGQNDTGTFEPNVQSQRFPTAPLGLLASGDPGVPDGVLHTSWERFAPRVGFAYDVFGNGRTALRGGYGVFYAVNQETFAANLVQQPFIFQITVNKTPNLVTPYAPSPDPFPYVFNPKNPTFTAGATMIGMPPNESSTPYVQEYNLTLEQQLSTNWGLQLAYVGSVSRKLYFLRDQNSPAYVPGAATSTPGLNARRPYEPTPSTYVFGQIGEEDPAGNASYNSLQATVTRRFDHGLSLLASYVWSKAMDDVSADLPNGATSQLVNNNDVAYDYGLSNLDVPQRFVASYLWAAPNVRHWSWLGRQVLSGWQFNGITTIQGGTPFNVTSGVDSNLDGNNIDRPDEVGEPALPGGRSRAAKIKEFFNTAAFAPVPADVPYGNAQRNSALGPAYLDTDFSGFKTFPVWEGGALQFRGEIFNLFNDVNLNAPVAIETSPQFGKITGSGSPRIVQFALRYSF